MHCYVLQVLQPVQKVLLAQSFNVELPPNMGTGEVANWQRVR